ncbi:MAG: glycerol kinase GlpK [Alphaproteobacteria bacterium]|nr:glycerol kinase GlpK [Alphaproteobacteria bacterium]
MAADPPFILAIDQGTTSTRAIVFDADGTPAATHAIALQQFYPANGWVEHDAEEIWSAVLTCCRTALRGISSGDIAAIGITNQRETTVAWDRVTGRTLHKAIVWQDRRTAQRCRALKARKLEAVVAARTGLLLDPYFSATKMEWLLDHLPEGRVRARRGEIALGTIHSWLLYKLTGGRVHATDVTNASRTMLLNLRTLDWDKRMLALFRIPVAALPEVRQSSGSFGETDSEFLGTAVPILGVAGDQQAAVFGQACFSPGQVKSTYGTGCFALVNTGPAVPKSKNRLISTCAFRAAGKTGYAIEGSIFIAGAVVQWLRDELGVIRTSEDIEPLAKSARVTEGLYFVPAFTGLGAPYWDPEARGAITGLTRDTGAAEIARAALDAVCYQTRDLLEAMARDARSTGLGRLKVLKVDGGMVRNDWFCQRLADLTGLPVDRPKITETTALGAAYLAGLAAGLFKDLADISSRWALDRRFVPEMRRPARDGMYAGWQRAVKQVRASAARV